MLQLHQMSIWRNVHRIWKRLVQLSSDACQGKGHGRQYYKYTPADSLIWLPGPVTDVLKSILSFFDDISRLGIVSAFYWPSLTYKTEFHSNIWKFSIFLSPDYAYHFWKGTLHPQYIVTLCIWNGIHLESSILVNKISCSVISKNAKNILGRSHHGAWKSV